jgi:ankyrin repeat protein
VRLLRLRGADVNARDRRGDTALHAACKDGKLAAVRELLACGANKDLLNHAGKLARDVVCKKDPPSAAALHVLLA